ncbi:MAG: benzoate-CoA ligase family protein [Polyangia bacterium]
MDPLSFLHPGTPNPDAAAAPPGGRRALPARYNAAVDLIDRHLAAGRGERHAFIDDAGALTYAELGERVDRAGSLLVSLGVQPEQRVLLVLKDTVSFPVLFFGAIKIGAVPVPVNTLLSAEDYAEIIADSRAVVLAVSSSLWPRVAGAVAAAAAPRLRHVLVDQELEGGGSADPPRGVTLHAGRLPELLARHHAELAPAPTTPDDACFWLYTSGSTGRLKAAVHAHGDMVYTAEHYAVGVLGLDERDVVFSAAKLFFAYGLGNAMSFPLYVGATAVLMAERPTPAAVARRLRAHRPTLFFGVPTLYAAMLADAELATGGRLRACVSAGEALPPEVGRRFKERTGVDILDGIGSTELLHIFLSNRPGDVRYGTTGRPVPGYALRLLDESGREVGPGEIGDLWVSGASSATHYFNRRALSQRTFVGPWTRTGDHYLRDADGYYVYQGRSDDMLKVSGQYVSPFEVESALVSHPAVLEAAVIGHADEHGLIKPRALVVLKAAIEVGSELAAALIAALQAHVKGQLAPFKYPRWIEFVAELPKTATGKIQRFKLRQPAGAPGA